MRSRVSPQYIGSHHYRLQILDGSPLPSNKVQNSCPDFQSPSRSSLTFLSSQPHLMSPLCMPPHSTSQHMDQSIPAGLCTCFSSSSRNILSASTFNSGSSLGLSLAIPSFREPSLTLLNPGRSNRYPWFTPIAAPLTLYFIGY